MRVVSQLEDASAENLTTAQEPAAGTIGRLWYNTDTSRLRADNGSSIDDVGAGLQVPTGTILDFAGPEGSLPGGYLICDGLAVSRATFASLFALVGTTYGVGDGSTTFNVPDIKGRVSVGKDDMGGAAANRITAAESGITGTTLGNAGGVEAYALLVAELASHNHVVNISDPGHLHAAAVASFLVNSTSGGDYAGGAFPAISTPNTATAFTGITATSDATGSGDTHQNVQPSIILNKMIKT